MTSLRECVEQQLNEIELLRCCYPSTEEFQLDDHEAFDQAKEFLQGKAESLERNLRFLIKLYLNEAKTTIELQFIYPVHYPQLPVDIHLRTYFSRECHEKFNESVKNFSETKLADQQPYVMEFLSWIQDHQELFLPSHETPAKTTTESQHSYARLWIYSHHIYNTEKRRNILHWANELRLNGFSLPGKPGIVSVEGEESDIDEYWKRLRNLTWKKLQLKEKQMLEKSALRFENFEELTFLLDNHGKGDFGQLYQYLQEKGLERMFHLYFGFDGTEKK